MSHLKGYTEFSDMKWWTLKFQQTHNSVTQQGLNLHLFIHTTNYFMYMKQA